VRRGAYRIADCRGNGNSPKEFALVDAGRTERGRTAHEEECDGGDAYEKKDG
jgi:hypothetical protein